MLDTGLTSTGPSDELVTVDKRDGSHWEIYDCPTKHTEERHTVKAICTNSGSKSNCWDLYKGFGVSGTVVELPDRCGPGRYAMAVSLETSEKQDKPKHLIKRGLGNETVYDFTFDYDFTPLQKRQATNVLLRVDYSDDPGYWDSVIGKTHLLNVFHERSDVQNTYENPRQYWRPKYSRQT
jgi:chitinase